MGAFNELIENVQCPNCRIFYEGKIQFKYGDTWQLEYRIGDKLKWGGNDIGKAAITKVRVYGILESDKCPACGKKNSNYEFDIFVENGVLTGVAIMEDYDYWDDENYKVLE